tara:strand:- start:547 stop:1356 length:810 start_codon:yes stop_codon:yes gene_type:complete
MNFKAFMNEIDDELKGTFNTQETLEPNFWPLGKKLRPSIRKRLIEIAQDFYDSLEIDAELKDITFTGSLANYNWSPHSDVDLHLIVDYKDVEADPELAKDYFNAKKSLWNRIHDILIDGYEVEVYVQDDNEPHMSTGVYSIMNDEWLTEPNRVEPSFDWNDITKKAEGIMDQVERAVDIYKDRKYSDALQYIEKLKEKIRKFRKAGLDRAGEFSSENIAFKVLRRNGYLEKLSNLKHMAYDRLMSKKSDGLIRIKLSESVKSWKEFLGK